MWERGIHVLRGVSNFFDKSNNYKPTLLKSESREFNKEIIGIEFEGTKNIIEPKTKNARIGL